MLGGLDGPSGATRERAPQAQTNDRARPAPSPESPSRFLGIVIPFFQTASALG
ncbi:hypothetical protein [Sinomonas sp.]|jgi:hypothetical protein|uniref:hypothetical protein n=1 Tax=Sinomonas sp. TaxID=1914986 RepID=UPI002BF14350|nr:hypothetical protein [Sinomonas sp.]